MLGSGLCHSPSLPDQHIMDCMREESGEGRKMERQLGIKKMERWIWNEKEKSKNEVIVTGFYEQFWETIEGKN